MAKKKVSENKSQKHHRKSMNEFASTVDMSVVMKAGFRVWVRGAKNGVGTHTQEDWEKLYKQFLTSK